MLRLLFLLPVFGLLLFLAAAPQGAGLRQPGGGVAIPVINTLTFGTPFKYSSLSPTHFVDADGMGNTWANDDQIYLNLDDTHSGGFDAGVSGGRNTMFGTMNGYTSSAIGTNYNTMDAWGTFADLTGADNRSHKIAGVISVQGTMYAWAWRLSGSGTGGQDGTLLKSTDNAAHWTPVPPSTPVVGQPYPSGQIMFPGNPIPMGFIQYGKDYSMIGGGALPDNASNYVYAMVIDDGRTSTSRRDEWLGRCPIGSIGNQNAADWTFWTNAAGDGNGLNNANWGTLAQAQATGSLVHVSTDTSTSTFVYYWNVVWLPAYQQYLAINGAEVPTNSTLTPYVAPHPWGPWRALPSTTYGSGSAWPIASFINPVTKSLVTDGGHTLTVFGSGDLGGYSTGSSNTYTLWITPATVN